MPPTPSVHNDESDGESLHDELSPTDGYFNQRQTHPGAVMVPDPSQRDTQSDKEREAREEAEANRAQNLDVQGPSTSSTEQPSTGQRYVRQASLQSSSPNVLSTTRGPASSSGAAPTEASPLITPAPPAYSPPSPGSPYHSHIRDNSLANIVQYNTMGRQEAFFPERSPEDLGGASDPLLGGQGRGNDGERAGILAWINRNSNKILKTMLLLLAIGTGIGFVINIVTGILNRQEGSNNNSPPVVPNPVYSTPPPSCVHDGMRYQDFFFDNPKSFGFLQLLSSKTHPGNEPYSTIRNIGELHVVPALASTKANIEVNVQFAASGSALLQDVIIERLDDSVGIYLPAIIPKYNVPSGSQPCFWMNATLSIKPSVDLSLLRIVSQSLPIFIHPELELGANRLSIASISSPIRAIPSSKSPNTSTITGPRDIELSSDSGSITGAYPLYDSLKIIARSGSVTVSLTPKPSDSAHLKPALLNIDSVSGSIHITTPSLKFPSSDKEIPPRDYRTAITSTSGSVTASLLHGSETTIKSLSGHVGLDLTPHGDPTTFSNLDVRTESGSVDTTIHGSLSHPGASLRKLSSRFEYETGSLQVRHPKEWEGKVRGRVLVGSIVADWPGLVVDRYDRNDGYWSDWVEAGKEWEREDGESEGEWSDFERQVDREATKDNAAVAAEHVEREGKVTRKTWGYQRFEAHKGNGYGSLRFDGVTGSVKLTGERYEGGRVE